MLQLENRTPFVASMCATWDEVGADIVLLMVKATFAFDDVGVKLAEEQRPLVLVDEYWGEPGESSLKYASEVHLPKPATDVAVVGAAFAPPRWDGRPFEASVSVGSLEKRLVVHGERVWQRSLWRMELSRARPVSSVPLVYERAFGGKHRLRDGTVAMHQGNPVGRGFHARGQGGIGALKGRLAPNFELPGSPLRRPKDMPAPAGLGFIAASWEPRVGYAGTYDEAWECSRAPFLPLDFDARFFHAVAADQVYPGFLAGGEAVELVNLSPRRRQRFVLPEVILRADARIGGRTQVVELRVETLLLEPEQGRFCLTWRGAIAVDKQVPKLQRVALSVDPMKGFLP